MCGTGLIRPETCQGSIVGNALWKCLRRSRNADEVFRKQAHGLKAGALRCRNHETNRITSIIKPDKAGDRAGVGNAARVRWIAVDREYGHKATRRTDEAIRTGLAGCTHDAS